MMKSLKLDRREKLLFAIPLLLLLVPLLSSIPHQDALDKKMQSIAEPNAIDCGRISPHRGKVTIPDSYMSCAVASTKAGKPFTLRLDAPNGHMSFGLIGGFDNKLTTINYYYRRRLGIKDWELIQVYSGKCKMQLKNGREEVSLEQSKQIE